MINYLANPARFARVAKWLTPLCGVLALIGIVTGAFFGLFLSPEADLHGQGVRMLYVHVPAAWCALAAYSGLAFMSLISFIWRHPLADSAAKSLAVPGLVFAVLCLATGSLWGKPAWGTWWQWDARMTSVLVLAFIYIAYLLLRNVIEDEKRGSRLAAILAMVGFINIPIIKFSVDWWNTLHQPASVSQPGAPGMPAEFLIPLLIMTLGYSALLAWSSLRDIQADLVRMKSRRERKQSPATVTLSEG